MIPVTRTELPLRLLRRGKVRDVYEIEGNRILVVATDRVSAFDVVMHEAVPYKGAVLTQLTVWWLGQLEGKVRHHLMSASIHEIVNQVPSLEPFARDLTGRSMLCRRAAVYPVECVIRGHLSGSAWKEYTSRGTLAGEALPTGLDESAKLPSPLFSPATKAEQGHDENITVSAMESIVGRTQAAELERLTRAVYKLGSSVAGERGIIIADTKLEFGYAEDEHPGDSVRRTLVSSGNEFDPSRVILVDEVLTPDSSRFWPAESFMPGRSQPSFDKQPLRDYLETERRAGRWNGESPPPRLPGEVVEAMSERYLDIYRRLTLAPLDTGVGN